MYFQKTLKEMPEQEFRDNIEALAAKRLEKPKTLDGRAGYLWGEIACGFYHFNRGRLVNSPGSIPLFSWTKWFLL